MTALCVWLALISPAPTLVHAQDMMDDISFFANIKDRSTGTPGAELAANHILKSFHDAGFKEVGVQKFLTPIPEVISSSLEVKGKTLDLYPWEPHLVYLPMTPREGLSGPLLYVGDGSIEHFDGETVAGSIVLMDMTSYGNWMNAATLGAKALIFLGDPSATRGEFKEKETPTPLAFPRFWAGPDEAAQLKHLAATEKIQAVIKCRTRWQNKLVRNCYAFVPGRDPRQKNELIVLGAFYDASSHVLGLAPGAGESISAAMLLSIARELSRNPPDRTVLLLATVGNGQGLAGMRQFISTTTGRKKLLRKEKLKLQKDRQRVKRQVQLLSQGDPFALKDPNDRLLIWQIVVEAAKDKADLLTRRIQYQRKLAIPESQAQKNAEDPGPYRRISWLPTMDDLTADQKSLALKLLHETEPHLKAQLKELKLRNEALKSSYALRGLMDEYDPILFLSLLFSSHSPYIGLSEIGQTYPVREDVRRIVRSARLVDLFGRIGDEVSEEVGLPNLVGRPSRGLPPAGTSPCDVGIVAGLPSACIMTLHDRRSFWFTPNDTLDKLDKVNLQKLSRFFPPLLLKLLASPKLRTACESGISGLASLEGQAMFIRQGELFPDQPAPATIISVIQGNSVFRAMTFRDGTFFIPGLANNRVSLEKLILEPYGLDSETGRVAWTADKVQTRKVNYRIKVKSDLASTFLVMFNCLQTDVIGTFNPQDMGYLTKVDLLDAATDATPLRYWFSRVDGRDTMAISVFLEEGTRFKLIMSPSLLDKTLFLLNSTPENPSGKGFLIGEPHTIDLTPYHVAGDLQLLLGERLENLIVHGIVNQHLKTLYNMAGGELNRSQTSLAQHKYSVFWKNIVPAWAKLDSIYSQVENTQRDVLAAVMFFIALLVPFAYCVERYLFCFRTIYQQILAFFLFLILAVLTIRALNPAFYLTYSPMVVILAFFIVGLSVLVSLIIFMRFEREMAEMHSKASHLTTPHVSKWQSFGAVSSIGVSNLNRRKLRTALTCMTLVILTFTVMSFTSVKSYHKTTRTKIADKAAYRGFLVRNQYWLPLTILTLQDMNVQFAGEASVWPRAWIQPIKSGDRIAAPIFGPKGSSVTEGILGLGFDPPDQFGKLVTHGRWFREGETDVMLLPLAMGKQMGLDPQRDIDISVLFRGTLFRVVGYFDGNALESLKDLDQNLITPAYLEIGQSEELSEVEVEAMQSGEQILPAAQRFRYANPSATVIIPFQTCLDLGGQLEAISILPAPGLDVMELSDRLTSWLSFPLFVGDGGVWYQSANTTLRYQGVANLAVPILIVIFITLNTMIGHVHERQREIATYTSVGLAPTHVGYLFIVEALSMAVISTVIGYILAQLSAKYLGNTSLFYQLTFNYSSLASVACMLLVFSVVFVAALYPARLAAEIAMPDVNRSWTLPPPQGDVVHMNLPFLLKYQEEKGVMGFLDSFYSSHQGGAPESFVVDDTRLIVDLPEASPGQALPQVCPLIRTNVWLAPFDFGIKQSIQLHCCPSTDNPGYLELSIRMTRLAGERSSWIRANKNFIKALRKQMLLWRLLNQEAKTHYEQVAPVEYTGRSETAPL